MYFFSIPVMFVLVVNEQWQHSPLDIGREVISHNVQLCTRPEYWGELDPYFCSYDLLNTDCDCKIDQKKMCMWIMRNSRIPPHYCNHSTCLMGCFCVSVEICPFHCYANAEANRQKTGNYFFLNLTCICFTFFGYF